MSKKIYIFPESGSGKHFQFSAMRAIDFSHDFTPKNSKILSYNRIFEKYGFFWNTLYYARVYVEYDSTGLFENNPDSVKGVLKRNEIKFEFTLKNWLPNEFFNLSAYYLVDWKKMTQKFFSGREFH